MKVNVYNQEGKELEQGTFLAKEIFEVAPNLNLLHQAVASQRGNQRINLGHTKTRAEVSGGGKKPWKQKGTGRARHGSIRSPIWRKGGIVFGPRKERNYNRDMSKSMRKASLFMALSSKAKDKEIFVLEELKFENQKTKNIVNIIKNLKIKGSALIILSESNKLLARAVKNIQKTSAVLARNLNTLDVLTYKYLIITKEGIKEIENNFLREKK